MSERTRARHRRNALTPHLESNLRLPPEGLRNAAASVRNPQEIINTLEASLSPKHSSGPNWALTHYSAL
jgi:hypothetical protein